MPDSVWDERLIGVLNQSSMVLGEAPTGNEDVVAIWAKSPEPSKLNAWPTSPAENVASPCITALFLPNRSFGSPSADHQEIMPLGGVTQVDTGAGADARFLLAGKMRMSSALRPESSSACRANVKSPGKDPAAAIEIIEITNIEKRTMRKLRDRRNFVCSDMADSTSNRLQSCLQKCGTERLPFHIGRSGPLPVHVDQNEKRADDCLISCYT